MTGTELDLTEILNSRNSSRSRISTSSMAARTSAPEGSAVAVQRRCSGSEPEFAPIRIGVPRSWARRTTCSTLSGPPMLPGLIRTAATPASIARSASEALKWMSAITGTGVRSTSSGSASASGIPGTATRTMSTPASTSRSICAIVASTSCVLVVVIDCTVTGDPPPIGTPPTTIRRSLAIDCIVGDAERRPIAYGPIVGPLVMCVTSFESPARTASASRRCRSATRARRPPARAASGGRTRSARTGCGRRRAAGTAAG